MTDLEEYRSTSRSAADFHNCFASMRKVAFASARRFIWIFLLLQLPGSAQGATPAGEIEEMAASLLESERLGEPGLLTTSQAVVGFYEHLLPVFRIALRETQDAARVAAVCPGQMPGSRAGSGQCVAAFGQMQAGREKYQTALRGVIAERRPLIERLLHGSISRVIRESDAVASEQASELAAVSDLHDQILRQKARLAPGQAPEILWPPGLSPELRSEFDSILNRINDAGWTRSSWSALEKRVASLREDLKGAADELRAMSHANWEQIGAMEKRAISELNILTEARFDMQINAVFQEFTVKKQMLAQNFSGAWGLREDFFEEVVGAAGDVHWFAKGGLGLIVASAAVLQRYPGVDNVFIDSHKEAMGAKRTIERFRGKLPRSQSQWGKVLGAFEVINESRNAYIGKLREAIDGRSRAMESVSDERLGSLRRDLDEIGRQSQVDLQALADAREQIYAQERGFHSGVDPVVDRPSGRKGVWVAIVEDLLDDPAASPNSPGSWRGLKRRLEATFEAAEATTRDFNAFLTRIGGRLDDLESALATERQILTVAENDLAANVSLQQIAERRERLLRQDYEQWQQAQE